MKVQRKVHPNISNVAVDQLGEAGGGDSLVSSRTETDMYFHPTVASLVDEKRRNALDACHARSVRNKVSTHPPHRKHTSHRTF